MNIIRDGLAATVRRLTPVLAVLALAVPAGGALAQTGVDLSTENVTVDLSVLEGGGSASRPAYMAGPGAASGGLLLPLNRDPVSTLHVAVPRDTGAGRIKLRPPGAMKSKKRPVKRAAAKPKAPAPKPAPAPAPKVAAKKPPEPLTTAPAAPAAAPPAPPAPAAAPTTAVATAAPPAPPPPAKKPAPAAPPAAKPAPPPQPAEQASLPPAADIKPGRAMQVAFKPDASKLPGESKDALTALADKLKGQDALRLQLMAYAGGKDLSASKARRLSLSRALSVRSFLIESGVRSTRIDVRALGSKTSEEPLNRVDVNIVER